MTRFYFLSIFYVYFDLCTYRSFATTGAFRRRY